MAVDVISAGEDVERTAPDLNFVKTRALPTEFGFDAERTEVVTTDQVEIDAQLVVDVERIVDLGHDEAVVTGKIEFGIFGDHRAAFDAGVPRLVASDSRSCQRGRSERSQNG